MGLNAVPSANRTHIGFFGCRNAGKSSVVNCVTAQDTAVVSDKKGTTTDPVSKTMELLPLGPVVITDTPGFDDAGELGALRVERTKKILRRTDIAVLVIDGTIGLNEFDRELIQIFKDGGIPYIIAYNKSDSAEFSTPDLEDNEIAISALRGDGIDTLKEKLGALAAPLNEKRLIGDLIDKGDIVVLVVPIDSAAPKGRLILPQQQAIRDILESGATAVVTKETELTETLSGLNKKPRMVVCDSQAFERVAHETPEEIPLTSFSILMARYKGFLETAIAGVRTIERLRNGDKILIAEGCTHHRQCEDIGTVKIPKWLKEHTNAELHIETASGNDFPESLGEYSLIIHCGGCMLNERELQSRMSRAVSQGVPFTNYGTAIAYMKGILERAVNSIC